MLFSDFKETWTWKDSDASYDGTDIVFHADSIINIMIYDC